MSYPKAAVARSPAAYAPPNGIASTDLNESLGVPVLQRRLRRSEARDRDAVGRAGDVIEPQAVAEGDGVRIAAMLAADTELERGTGLAAAFEREQPWANARPAL